MKDVAIVGLPFSGKSTVFTAVARQHTAAASQKANLAVVAVPDPRVDELARLHNSGKNVYAQVRLTDVPGLDARALAAAREADALAVVLRGFGDDVDPLRDLAAFRAELAVADLQTIEKGVERTKKAARMGPPAAKHEAEVYEKAEAVLSSDRWLSEQAWEPDDRRVLQLATPLTLKPVMHVLNLDETSDAKAPDPGLEIRGLLEAEAAELEPDDALALLEEFGVSASATSRFLSGVYGLLNLVTFYTAGDMESRAWEIPAGAKAPQAGGAIHSDLEKGFIRCETVAYDDLVAAGSWDGARERGALRLEGKEYVVQDGDVVHIRHS